jgi:hypothetical protein
MIKALASFLVIGGTAVAVINLSCLVPTNPNYEASWLKVAFAATMVVWGVAELNFSSRRF